MALVEFNLNGKDYELPDVISVGDYVKIFKIKDLFEDEYMKAKVVNLISDCPMDTLLESENHKVDFLATSIFAMVPRPPYKFVDRFKLDGVEYGYLPSYKEITFAEFVDLDSLLTKKNDEVMDYLHVIAAIMYRPIISEKSKHDYKIEKYNQDTLNDRAELFKKKLDIRFALGGQFFFTRFGKKYSTYTQLSLKNRMIKEWESLKFIARNWKTLWKLALKKDSDGTLLLIKLQQTELMHTMKSLIKKSSK